MHMILNVKSDNTQFIINDKTALKVYSGSSIEMNLTGTASQGDLKLPITTIVVCFVICLSSACDFKSFLQTVWTQIRLLPKEQSDQGPHCWPVCKNRFEKFARIFRRRHKQMSFSDASFLGILRVNMYPHHTVKLQWFKHQCYL